ncbi:MAG: alpha/beta hydrolase [Planctomycetota bacterium]
MAFLLLFLFSLVVTETVAADEPVEQPAVVRLWPKGAPGFESRANEAEEAKDWWVRNIHNPSLTVFQPSQDKRCGVAAVIVPGGGHRKLVFDAEGTMMARHLTKLGITAFVLKHRLPRQENSPYDLNVHPKQDGIRAMRWVRHHAKDYDVDPERIGMVGFSAGGEVVSWVTYGDDDVTVAVDAIDQQPFRPAFQVLIYPGPLGIPELGKFPDRDRLPPAFLVVAADDGAAENLIKITTAYRKRKTPVELHLYARGGHGFNMGQRSTRKSLRSWPDRLDDWLKDEGWTRTTKKLRVAE